MENKLNRNILIVIPTLGLGGAERIAVNTYEVLKKDYNVNLAYFDCRNCVYKISGNLIDMECPVRNGYLGKIVNVFQRIYKLYNLKRKLKIDVCISFGEAANLVNVLSKYKELVLIRLGGYKMVSNSIKNKVIYKRADGIICVSNEIKIAVEKVKSSLRNKTYTLYNPYDIDDIMSRSQEKVEDYKFEGLTIVTHGRLEFIKNHQRLIKAFSIVKKKLIKVNLLIIGKGPIEDELRNLTEQLGVSDSVTLIGYRENPFSYIAKSDLYVLASAFEGFPNALVEGMLFLPVIAADCRSGPREIIVDQMGPHIEEKWEAFDTGILVSRSEKLEVNIEMGKAEIDLADAIIYMLSNQSFYVKAKQNAHERAKQFGVYVYKRELENIFKYIGENKEVL